jgi:hypothetical protein
MVQAHAYELLNQKESKNAPNMADTPRPSLFVATERLLTALDRLERNLQNVALQPPQDSQVGEQLIFFERENESLRQERENLNQAISQLQHQYSDLHQVASTIYGKLDDSIKRLTQIIEN